jgi:N-acylneuraminate cytidylyltransferase
VKLLALIPARGGSKGIPGKNTTPLAGKSLIQRAFECAIASRVVDRTIISTDDPAIAATARECGLEVPFLRPAEYARDSSPMIDVALHALGALQHTGYMPDALLLLQPTSPLRQPAHLQTAVQLLADNDAVCSVTPVPKDLCPHYVMKIGQEGFLDYFLADGPCYTRRQDVPQAYRRDGTIFLTRVSVLLGRRSFYGTRCVPLVLRPDESLNVDEPADWLEAERRLAYPERIGETVWLAGLAKVD